MAKKWSQRLTAVVLFILAVALIVTGVIGMGKRESAEGQALLREMRVRSLLSATGAGVVESYVDIAKVEARERAKAEGGNAAAIREAVAKAEEEARASNTAIEVDTSATDVGPLTEHVDALQAALMAYSREEAVEMAAYIERMRLEAEDQAVDTAADAPASAEDLNAEGGDGLDLALPQEEQVDLSGFVASARMNELMAVADEQYRGVGAALKGIYPVLTDSALDMLKDTVMRLVYHSGDQFASMFDRFGSSGGDTAIQAQIWSARMMRYGDDLITLGCGLIVLALLILFYQSLIKALGLPRLIIGTFFLLLCMLALLYDLNLPDILSSSIVRLGMNVILVLAMLPGIQCGINLNLGLPIGIVGGLLGGLMCIEMGHSGWFGFWYAIAIGMGISAVCGYLYGLLLNRLKGNEMAVTTYVGFSVISVMCIAWLTLPFSSIELRWPLGTGLRNTLQMNSSFKHILDDWLAFSIGSFKVPTGLLICMGVCCLIVWLFSRSKTGVAMQAAGNNPRFAEATGINVDRMRIIGTTISTVLGAIGILVYSQSYGFMQLYTAPRQMGFIAASAILIGGASTTRARISHVIIGTFLFQGVLTLGMPVANALVPQSTISETMRILISNGIILYALTKSGGASRA